MRRYDLESLQLNESCEFGKQPRQQNRFFCSQEERLLADGWKDADDIVD